MENKTDITLPWIRTGKVHDLHAINSKQTGELICMVPRESRADNILKYANSHEELLEAARLGLRIAKHYAKLKSDDVALLEIERAIAKAEGKL